MNLLRRREMLQDAGEPLPEWDYEWWGANEKVDPTGWTKTTSGTTSTGLSGGYWRVQVSTQYGWVQYAWPETFSKGVIQVNFRFSTTYGNFRLYLSNGTNAIGTRATYANSATGVKGLLLNNADAQADMTQIASFAPSKTFQLKLVLDNGFADVYWRNFTDGEDFQLVASHVDITTITSSSPLGMTTLRFTSTASTGNAANWYLYGIMMKFNRTE